MVASRLVARVLGFVFPVVALGCASTPRAPAMEAPAFEVLGRNLSEEADSLFRGDSAILSDTEIDRILSFDFRLRDANRIAVLSMEGRNNWSEDYAKMQSENQNAFLTQLKAARGVKNVSQLPGLLIPDKKTVPLLREAAARFQANLLVVYQTRVRTYSKYRTVGKDQVKAQCVVEAVLLDVRTGIIPYSTAATEEVSATRGESDINFSETVAKATATSAGAALSRVGADIVGYLSGRRDT